MSFINWGQEGPEQKEIRKRFEDRELFEQAMMAYARSSSAMAGAAGSGGRQAILEITVDSTENLGVSWCIDSSAPTTFTVNWGDGVIEEYTASECFNHTYAEAGTWNVVITFANALRITQLNFND
jgi:hypothetical protein